MSKVIEGAEVHDSMFEVWRHWWVTAVGAKRTFVLPESVASPWYLCELQNYYPVVSDELLELVWRESRCSQGELRQTESHEMVIAVASLVQLPQLRLWRRSRSRR